MFSKKAFTLIELLVVIAILAIFASIIGTSIFNRTHTSPSSPANVNTFFSGQNDDSKSSGDNGDLYVPAEKYDLFMSKYGAHVKEVLPNSSNGTVIGYNIKVNSKITYADIQALH